MKQLKTSIYKNICSILASNDRNLCNLQTQILFSKAISEYPSKSIHCLSASRLIAYYERGVNNIQLIIELMVDEGEEQEIIDNVKFLNKNPTITTSTEVIELCTLLADYVKWAKILKVKNSFIRSLDILEDDEANVKDTVDTLYNLSNAIQMAYNTASVASAKHMFDTSDLDGMKTVVASTIDSRSADKCIITSMRMVNQLLSPGYLSGGVYVWAGLPGNYKSGMLLESHVDTCLYNEHLLKATSNGKTPISMYISMENTMEQTVRRLWSILFPASDMDMFSVDEVCEMIMNKLTSKGVRSVLLYYGYRTKSTADIANIIRSYNTEHTEVVALYFDYIKRVRSARTDAAVMNSEKSELHAIMNEFKLMAVQFNIPIVTGHQLNRMAAQAVDDAVAKGNYDKSSQVLGRSQVGTAFEILEVADFLGILNIENQGDQKYLMIKAAKQRDIQGPHDNAITAIRHPFTSADSFALKPDIMENCSVSIPIYHNRHIQNTISAVI